MYASNGLLKSDNARCANISKSEPRIINEAALPFLSTKLPKIGVKRIVPRGRRLAVFGPLCNHIPRVFRSKKINNINSEIKMIMNNAFPFLLLIFAGPRENPTPKINKARYILAFPRAALPKRIIEPPSAGRL